MNLQNKILLTESDASVPRIESEGQACVLLAEDDRALRRFLEVVLERAGYRVVSVSDGLEAMKAVVSQPIDVVITDSMMPNLSGHEFCRFLRSNQKLSHIPIILLSALERKEANHNVEHADAFLSKPVSSENLIECIEKLLAGVSD
ncbi:MAG TPA: response regulator [Pyrinomonadaceae bacterium]|jgi:twitching motility two-component system response regulator PilH|nr:response regulator [Pyrinomonadaceae bacterium]